MALAHNSSILNKPRQPPLILARQPVSQQRTSAIHAIYANPPPNVVFLTCLSIRAGQYWNPGPNPILALGPNPNTDPNWDHEISILKSHRFSDPRNSVSMKTIFKWSINHGNHDDSFVEVKIHKCMVFGYDLLCDIGTAAIET
jgi:hypothetical protein